MFERKEVKREAKKNLKRNYLKIILFVFICSLFVTGSYNFTSSNGNDVEVDKNITRKIRNEKKSVYDILVETITKEPIQENKQKSKKEKIANGVLAPIVNDITEKKSVVFGFVNVFNKGLFGGKVNEVLIMFICTSISLLFTIFIRDVFVIGKNRFFLEQRRYEVKMDKLFFPFRIKKTCHLAYILFMKGLFEFLWNLTIIGGFIKYYEYKMIPYILAENPNISRKDVFRLSKEMTDGEKWHLFVLDMSMILWYILDAFTFGFVSLFFTDAYTECIGAEVYMKLRKKIDGKMDGDEYLFVSEYMNTLCPESNIVKASKTRNWLNIDYNKDYGVTTYIMFFFTFAMMGWLWEVFLSLLTTGHFVNRGTLFGPWLPIYGFGIVLILLVLKPFRKEPIKLFIFTVILCGILEYSTAWYLETFKHMKWWDYTGYFLNLHGRICFEGLLVFGFGGAMITYFAAPLLNNVYVKIMPKMRIVLCVILLTLFGADVAYSFVHPNTGDGVTNSLKNNLNTF